MPRRAKGGTGRRGRPRKSQNPAASLACSDNLKSREGGSYKDFVPDLDIRAPLATVRIDCRSPSPPTPDPGGAVESILSRCSQEETTELSPASMDIMASGGASNHVSGVDMSVLPKPSFQQIIDTNEVRKHEFKQPANHYMRYMEPSESELLEIVEYDMDEQDDAWLEMLNVERQETRAGNVSCDLFESIMDRLEKEWFILIRDLPPFVEEHPALPEDSPCEICDDNEGENSNAIVFCDGCNLAVHQDCYGIPYIPEGQWLCRKCMLSPERPVSCLFCPNKGGAFKQTNTNAWAHLLCAMWIPETGVGNNIYMEPVDNIEHIPKSRWKLTCCICRKRYGACIQCDNKHCFAAFHATCARRAGFSMRMKTHTNEGVILKAYCDRHRPRESDSDNAPSTKGPSGCVQHSLQKSRRYNKKSSNDGDYLPTPDRSILSSDDESNRVGRKRKRVVPLAPSRRRSRTRVRFNDIPIAYQIARAYQHQYSPAGAPIVPETILIKLENLTCVLEAQIKEKSQAITSICHYWSLKRESRRGAPLLKRLHLEPWRIAALHSKRSLHERAQRCTVATMLRSDLEIARMLTGQVQKREKLKLERIRRQKAYLELILFPVESFIRPILERLVDLGKEGGLQHIGTVFSAMARRLTEHSYFDLHEFEDDLEQTWPMVIVHCNKNSIDDETTQKLQTEAGRLLAQAKENYRQLEINHDSEGTLAVDIHPELFTYTLPADYPSPREAVVPAIAAAEDVSIDMQKRRQLPSKQPKKATLQQETDALQVGSSKSKPAARRRTRSSGTEALAETAEELEKKSARMSTEARRLFTSFVGLKLDHRAVVQYKKDDTREAPPGWIYVEESESDSEEEGDEQVLTDGVNESSSPPLFKKDKSRQKALAPRPPVSYVEGEVVWARVCGFPAHPAKIVDATALDLPKRILSSRTSEEEVLVQFYMVPERHKWGWVAKTDIVAFGSAALDQEMLMQAKKSKRSTRIKEAQRGYRFVCNLQNIDPEPQLHAIFHAKK